MASSYPPPFEGAGEVKEGFLCPLCLKDLQSFYQLQEHYEEEHSGDDGNVKGQIKSKFEKNGSGAVEDFGWPGFHKIEASCRVLEHHAAKCLTRNTIFMK